jgi:hypothetical protein
MALVSGTVNNGRRKARDASRCSSHRDCTFAHGRTIRQKESNPADGGPFRFDRRHAAFISSVCQQGIYLRLFIQPNLMPKSRKRRRSTPLVFEKRNYALLGIGVAMIAIGFAVMRLENEFLGTISLYVAPLLILGGYAEVIYAILWRSDESKERIQKAREEMAKAEQASGKGKKRSGRRPAKTPMEGAG